MRKGACLVSLALIGGLLSALLGCGGGGKKAVESSPGSAPGPGAARGNTTGLPLSLPAGFSISRFADGMQRPRVLAWDPGGTLLVSDMQAGQVLALPDRNGDGLADEKVVVADGLDTPHGLAFMPGDPSKLYVAETAALSVYDYDRSALKAAGRRKLLDLPADGEHITRTIMFLPPPDQGTILISVGSSENVTYNDDSRRAAILAANADGSGLRPYAIGLRNSVFMAVHPVTHQVWATENGRDFLGDNLPPDEINIIKDGGDYGWPTCYGKNVHDTQFDTRSYPPGQDPCAGKVPAYIDIPAHSAPLGLAFVTSRAWPAEFADDLLVCYHGSWNRTVPTGDKVVRVRLDRDGGFKGIEDFITGWQRPDGSRLGRPVGILFSGDGTAYISDDDAGIIYRLAPPPG